MRVAAQAPDSLAVSREDGEVHYRFSQIAISSRLGNSARYLELPGGEKLQTSDNDAVDAVLRAMAGDHPHGLLHALEAHWGWVSAAAVFTVAVLWWSVFVGLPMLAERTAHVLPVALEDAMGSQSLSMLDTHLLDPTRLQEVQRERVRALFASAVAHSDLDYTARLELRRSEDMGANAFALPSGIVVVTDELVELARTDGELVSVIVHELGHVQHRHIMRSLLQNSAVALLVATLLGDVSSVTGLAASIPTLLVEQGYSREFEFEADLYAAEVLDEMGVGRAALAAMLRRLGDSHGVQRSNLTDYLSTHPSTLKRIEAVEATAHGD